MKEIWLPIPGWEETYSASSLGRIRSESRKVWIRKGEGHWHQYDQTILAPAADERGYLYVTLCAAGKRERRSVHSLIALTFIGPRPEGEQCRHRDGNPGHNGVSNLLYGTASQNRMDSVAHGTHANARKTDCKFGHEFTPENIMWRPDGRNRSIVRRCRECKRASDRAGRLKRKRAA